jgi:hypothetical protein
LDPSFRNRELKQLATLASLYLAAANLAFSVIYLECLEKLLMAEIDLGGGYLN